MEVSAREIQLNTIVIMSDLPFHIQNPTDSREYNILWDAARASCSANGASFEIGVRLGGSSEVILRATAEEKSTRVHVGIDPWGSLPYPGCTWTYPSDQRRTACKALFEFAGDRALDLVILPFKDTDFFEKFWDGVPFYREDGLQRLTEYSLVFFDGPHDTERVMKEIEFFALRTPIGGYWVFDDVDWWDQWSVMEQPILDLGFERVDDVSRLPIIKASYRRFRL
jgi:hypothetical protein